MARFVKLSLLAERDLLKCFTRSKSTTTTAFGLGTSTITRETAVTNEKLDLSFQDYEAAYRSKTTLEVFRAWLVFNLCSSRFLVDNNKELMKFGRRILGRRLFSLVMKSTFYGQFVAGADRNEIKPLLDRMRSFGVKSILDYSAEDDISPEQAKKMEMQACSSTAAEVPVQDLKDDGSSEELNKRYRPHPAFADRRSMVLGARTYFYMNEAQCESNLDTFLKCIDAVSGTTKSTGFAAIKLTALGRPQLLMQLSEVIARTRSYFREVTGSSDPGNIVKHHMPKDSFSHRLVEAADAEIIHSPEVNQFLEQMTYDKKGLIHLFSWHGLINTDTLLSDLFRVPNLETGKMEPIISALTDEEEEMFANMMRRLRIIFTHAKENNVRVMVDAEQSYFQPAISRITMEMMRKFNKEKAIVFNTYQCYLKEAYENVVLDIEQAFRQGFYFGAKLVRGAYMEQERARAKTLGYEDPVNPSFEATTQMYHKTMTECMLRILDLKNKGMDPQRIAIMAATHNEDSVRFIVKKIADLGIGPQDRVVCFGQLQGMCDQISFPLGQAGYSVYKYVPYGPVEDVLPYLSRRAAENKGFLANVQKEKTLLRKELFRRIKRLQFFHTPHGDYNPL